MLLIGLACFGAAWVPYVVQGKPISLSIISLGLGFVAFNLPLGLIPLDPLENNYAVERLSEFLVIIALMGVGLKLDRPLGWRRWMTTWRLLAITMLLCIAAFAGLSWWVLGLAPAAALLIGAVLAPTDPVLAADVQAGPPQEGEETEVRFGLTSESGLNDGLAFPFTHLALAVAAAGSLGATDWGHWLAWDVAYKLTMGTLCGIAFGMGLAWLIFRTHLPGSKTRTGEGIAALAVTLITYAATELLHGYGFLAVFVAALMIRRREREHKYHQALHDFAENLERILMAVLLFLFGGSIAGGLLDSLTWPAVALAFVFVLVVRPLAGWIGLWGSGIPCGQRVIISFFGIRGVGSTFYLSYALEKHAFAEAGFLWSFVGLVIFLSVLIHGVLAGPMTKRFE